jgi:hypothetical protein
MKTKNGTIAINGVWAALGANPQAPGALYLLKK